jgi:hypothetical protein
MLTTMQCACLEYANYSAGVVVVNISTYGASNRQNEKLNIQAWITKP